jgi:hypothetical protein
MKKAEQEGFESPLPFGKTVLKIKPFYLLLHC